MVPLARCFKNATASRRSSSPMVRPYAIFQARAATASGLQIERTGNEPHCVPDDFRFNAPRLKPREQPVFGIVRLRIGRHLVSAGQDDATMQVLEAPAVLNEINGEPVEQLGVRGPVA